MTVEAYYAALPAASQDLALQMRAAIHAAVPGLTETLKYGMPAFQRDGSTVVYLGAWKRHIALYPIYRGDEDFEARVGPYRADKDSIRFALNKPIPLDLVALIAQHQAKT